MVNVSYVCLIYKSTKWLKFVYEQFHKYTKLNEGDEFYFVANDAYPEVLNYLNENTHIKHYIHENTEEQKKDWYINNVYRAWNKGGKLANGDYIIFLNSDMAFSKDWNIELIKNIDNTKCINSRLIERGPPNGLPTMVGGHGIEKSFGDNYDNYDEENFIQFSNSIKKNEIIKNGLYMPMIIKKEHLEKIGYYPEGNITLENFKELQNYSGDYNNFIYKYSTPFEVYRLGKTCVPGDKVLMFKLSKIGVEHYTCMNSIVYHFQQGEMSE